MNSMQRNCISLDNIKVFVLDEADVMIAQQGHREQTIRVIWLQLVKNLHIVV